MFTSNRTGLEYQRTINKVFYKQGVLKNIAKFTGKHRCQSFFFNRAHLVAAFSVSEIKSLYLLNDLININEIISKNAICDFIKSHRKSELHPLFRKHNFGKIIGGGGRGSSWPPSSFLRVNYISFFKLLLPWNLSMENISLGGDL